MFKIAIEIDIDELVKKALQIQDKRAKTIVLERFGLTNPEKRTLASLGEEYNLTRERVRQIEAATLRTIRERIETEKQALAFLEMVEGYLKNTAELRRSDLLAHDIALMSKREEHPLFENKLVFLAKVLGRPYIEDETQEMYATWHLNKTAHKLALKLVDKLLTHKTHDFDDYLAKITKEHELPEPVVINYLSTSKRFGVGPYGHMGADHWLRVNPKTVKDKAHLVLEQRGEAMHFREVAELVNGMSDRKRAAATVHNELIRDPRFVLLGRGIYGLDESNS